MTHKQYNVLDKPIRIFSIEEGYIPVLGTLSCVAVIISVLLGSFTDILTGMSVMILLEIILIFGIKNIQKKSSIGDIKKKICSRKLPIRILICGFLFRGKLINHVK